MFRQIITSVILLCAVMLFCSSGRGPDGRIATGNIKIADYRYPETENPLPIPPLLENNSKDPSVAGYELVVQKGETEFFKGIKTITLGYNGSFLGPTIRLRRGQTADIKVNNKLLEVTTVHWHGMLVPGDVDGGPHQIIRPGSVWHPRFKVNQPAATAWYHPHGLGTTAIQVYKGLAGMIIVDDEISDRLNIPHDYGVNDIPLIVQDRRFTTEGIPVYITNMRDIMEGMKGNTILVNGAVNAVFIGKKIRYRFRILNGSNARVYNFRFSDGKDFHQIATDGGFLEKPYLTDSIILSPGERAEIIADFSGYKTGSQFYLESDGGEILKIVITDDGKDLTEIPGKLAKINPIPYGSSVKDRYFSLEGMGFGVNINGKKMNMSRIDEHVKFGTVETWHIRSLTHGMGMMGMMGGNVLHNFHAHGVHFQIIDRGGRPPSPYEAGWKDTILLENGEPVKVLVRFLYKGMFMYHCHILEHEDNGMMGQFMVK